MGLKEHNNRYGDLVDEVDDLVMYGSQVNWAMASTIHLVTTCTLVLPCHGYCITKVSPKTVHIMFTFTILFTSIILKQLYIHILKFTKIYRHIMITIYIDTLFLN